jgi:shikimate dehydrogenase
MGIPYAEVIGDPIAQSKSPAIHKFWLEKLGLDGDYRATCVTEAELPDYLAERRADPDWRGCNVTMPLKQAVIPLLDSVRDDGVGAINCITPQNKGLPGFRKTKLYGINTDGVGVDEAIASWFSGRETARICMIGSGGAARSVIAALGARCDCAVDLIARDEAKGQAFLKSCNVEGYVYSFDDAPVAMADRLGAINASPLGMTGFPPMPESVLAALGSVGQFTSNLMVERYAFDMVTTPVRTAFMQRAEAASLVVSDGLAMLIGQAREAFQAFFGARPPKYRDLELRRLLTS